ncbi:hypothetical protein E2C01_063845 [Portunus trituberculatus]|uniref:Uncharacterized protein n=1 Tax=Portunus trituberculatus TaxID=210409 RepID=A0A5B7HJA6_PORTR|nr:hypothetical protein [Portunus trituberculatus]
MKVKLKLQCSVCESKKEAATGDARLTPVSREGGQGGVSGDPTSPHQHKTPRRHLSLRSLKKQRPFCPFDFMRENLTLEYTERLAENEKASSLPR